jgi:hypothetical protein
VAEAELYVAARVGEVVVPGAEGGEVGGQEEGAGAVETARRWVPGFLEDGEPFESALAPGGDRTRQVGGGAAGCGGEGRVQGSGGGGEA